MLQLQTSKMCHLDVAFPVHEAPPSLMSPFHPFRSTPLCSVILGRVARKTRRDASVAKLFCPRVREKFPPVPLLFRCAWESSYLLISLFLLAAGPENTLPLSFCRVAAEMIGEISTFNEKNLRRIHFLLEIINFSYKPIFCFLLPSTRFRNNTTLVRNFR